MSTVLNVDGYRVWINTNDHPPAHVHVKKGGCEAVFLLNCPNGPVKLRDKYRFKVKDLSRIEGILNQDIACLCAKWSEIHGDPS